MRIAQIAPPWITIPPKNYGGTESVVYNLVEEQVAQGHDVTLFAPGDAKTSARLISFFPKSLIQQGVPWTMHLKAFYHLQIEVAKQADVPLALAGTIDRYEKASVSYFHEQIKPQVDNEQIKYIGPMNMRQKVNLLNRAHGFLNPIEWEEPFGIVMIEAMAVGCPVISFDRGAASEIVAHGETGFLVHTTAEMAQCIPHIDEIDRDALPVYVEQNFSARVMAEKYVRIYEKVIKMNGVATREK